MNRLVQPSTSFLPSLKTRVSCLILYKRELSNFILKEIKDRGSGRDQRDTPYSPTKSDIVDILIKFEESKC